MDESLNSVPVVVEHEHNRIQTQLQHIRESLHCQVQAAFAGNKDTSLVIIVLSDGFERSYCSASGITNTAEDRLIIHAGAAGELRGAESEC
jgi:hypothetical protein